MLKMMIIEGILAIGMMILSACSKDYREADIKYTLGSDYPQLAAEQVGKIEELADEHFLHADSDMHILVNSDDLVQKIVAWTNCDYPNGVKQCVITFNNYWLYTVQYPDEIRRQHFFKLVFTHEIGHAFGLMHVSDIHNIMYPQGILEYQDNDASYDQYISDIKTSKNK